MRVKKNKNTILILKFLAGKIKKTKIINLPSAPPIIFIENNTKERKKIKKKKRISIE